MDKFIHTNGIQIHYLEHQGSGQPLVLMPGLTANAHAFDGLMQAGLDRYARVLALDLRGRGLSEKPLSGYSMAEHAADVIGLLDALELEQVVLGGHSFGGFLSFYLAAHFPERINRLIVIDAAAILHPQARSLLEPALGRLGKVYDSAEAYLEAMKQMPYFHAGWDAAIESSYRAEIQTNADGTVQHRSTPEAIGAALDGLLAERWDEHLTGIPHPTLLFNALGAYGLPGAPPLVPREAAIATVNRLAQGRYVEVQGNHVTMLYGQGAQHIVAAIGGFLTA